MTQQMERLKQDRQYIEWPTNKQWQQWQQQQQRTEQVKAKQNG
jgi:hypothetical protein